LVAAAALSQARTAGSRHNAQTEADRQRRIIESFSKAVEQLGSEKIEARLGGIYTLERIAHESAAEYWIVMETLTAFVRERARWKEPDAVASETIARFYEDKAPESSQANHEPATDIAAVLSVIVRRGDKIRDREKTENWHFNLKRSDLRRVLLRGAHLEGADLDEVHLEGADLVRAHLEGASIPDAHLEGADLAEAHLERAYLGEAHLERADLRDARLEGANLRDARLEEANLVRAHLEGAYLGFAHLERADLRQAHLERANLGYAHFEGADLTGAHFEGADLTGAHFEGVDLTGAHLERANLTKITGLNSEQLAKISGDTETILPSGVSRPTHWPSMQ
jgi:uncharacterized protein YjbI with pentapeptide repeats